jgi:hypothetical protein
MIQQKALPMSFLVENGGLSKEDGSAAKYLAGVLIALIRAVGQERAASMWKACKMNIEDFVPKDKVSSFASSHVSKLHFKRTSVSVCFSLFQIESCSLVLLCFRTITWNLKRLLKFIFFCLEIGFHTDSSI